jgi:hypothetical protein
VKVSASNGAVALSLIPEAVRQQAEDDAVSGPAPPPELNMERVLTARYGVLLTEVPSWNIVQRLRLEGEDVAATVAEVRALLRARGRAQAAWCVGPSSAADLIERLLRLGLIPYAEPPYEAHTSCMALVRPPRVGAVGDVLVERAETLEALEAAEAIAAEAFGMRSDERRAVRAGLQTRLRLQQEGRPWVWQYLASIDGGPSAPPAPGCFPPEATWPAPPFCHSPADAASTAPLSPSAGAKQSPAVRPH